ncbi:MAG: hypothetical protein JWO30_1715 [Fibrobacteres bacterium]|nr:hypothetical protein [Fibrobacterota bacterium]
MSKMLMLAGFMTASSYAGPWSDSLANAILSKNHPLQRRLVESRPGQCTAVTGLQSVAMVLQSRQADTMTLQLRPKAKVTGPWSVPAFEWALKPDFGDACYPEFEHAALDSTAPETFRMAVLNVMLEGAKKLGAVPPSATHSAMMSILFSSGTSMALKAFVLQKSGKMAESSYEQDFSPFLRSNDSTLREAAFQGLIRKINDNGFAGKKTENKAIFTAFKKLVLQPISLGQVGVLATLREDYSRDFLLAKCAGDRQKLAVIFIRDGNVRHAGLIAEAAKQLRAVANPAALEKAVSQGIKDPEGTIGRLLEGSPGELLDGLTLLRVFPKNAASHASLIIEMSKSFNPELNAAAQDLLPYLPTASK